MSDDRPEILQTPAADTSGFAVAARPLGFWTKAYGNGAVRKSVLLVLLAAAWEIGRASCRERVSYHV